MSALPKKSKKGSVKSKRLGIWARYWEEDKVWNASAVDLPVAAFGKTFREAKSNLRDAILTHFDTLRALGQLDEVIRQLSQDLDDCNFASSIESSDELFARFTADPSDRELSLV